MRAAVALAILLASATTNAASPLYDRLCSACHGAAGDGKGPAAPWLDPLPRDFTRGVFKWRSTASGRPPSDADLIRTIAAGAPGTSMPGFAGILDDAQLAALAAEVRAFGPARSGNPSPPVAVPPRPATLPDGVAAFRDASCTSCHASGVPTLRRGQRPEDIYLTLATGLDGTAMPAYSSATAEDKARLWALVGEVERLRPADSPTAELSALAQKRSVPAGLDLPPQGEPPLSLPPAATSLSAAQCGRCHAKQLREWQPTMHAAAFSPGVAGQLVGVHPGLQKGCLDCHAPLAEQRGQGDADLGREGVSCAGCHLRSFVRHGPERRPESGLLALPAYPFVVDAAYERSDFCLPCHQLGPDLAVNGRPLLDTYREWLTGPYQARGVQCQHCHMPNREHTFRGIHDREAVSEGLRIRTAASPGAIEVTLENIGAGHDLPTTTTPALFVAVVQGQNEQERRVGRHLVYDGTWREREDTRIPPGGKRAFRFAVPAGGARVRVTVAPDEYYERFYAQLLGGPSAKPSTKTMPPEAKRELEAALQRARSSRFILYDQTIAVPAATTASPRRSP